MWEIDADVDHLSAELEKAARKRRLFYAPGTKTANLKTNECENEKQGIHFDRSTFAAAIVPVYIKNCPLSDQWGNPLQVYSGSAVSGAFAIPADEIGDDDIVIASRGRGGEDDGWTYDPDNSTSGWYTVTAMPDFRKDLVNMNGSWLRGPRISNPGT